MQIDCSVVNTTLVKLKSNALPESLRKTNHIDNKPINVNPKPENRNVKFKNDSSSGDTAYNTSNNLSDVVNYNKDNLGDIDINKNDLFTQYLLSKSRHAKHESIKITNVELSENNKIKPII